MHNNTAIKVENVWKIFGNPSPDILKIAQANKISKKEALEKYNIVIGVADVTFDVKQGGNFLCDGIVGEWQIYFSETF